MSTTIIPQVIRNTTEPAENKIIDEYIQETTTKHTEYTPYRFHPTESEDSFLALSLFRYIGVFDDGSMCSISNMV